jgi:hypothetical protein
MKHVTKTLPYSLFHSNCVFQDRDLEANAMYNTQQLLLGCIVVQIVASRADVRMSRVRISNQNPIMQRRRSRADRAEALK